MVGVALLVGVAGSVLAGAAIGGAAMSIAFGPSVESDTVSPPWAAALLTVFALAGGLTVGRRVVDTLADDLLLSSLPATAGIAVVLAVALAVALSDASGIPASTSVTAVGAVAAVGIAGGSLNWATVGQVTVWWLLSPVVALWCCGLLGRYVYPHVRGRVGLARTPGPLVTVDVSGDVPRLAIDERAGPGEVAGSVGVVAVGCFVAFGLGASNVANAVAPLVGSGVLTATGGILLGGVAMGLGAATIGRRVGTAVTAAFAGVPLSALLIVGAVTATIVTLLAAAGVPASFVLTALAGVVGLALGSAGRDADEPVRDGSSWRPMASLATGAPDAASIGSDAPLSGTNRGTFGAGSGDGPGVPALATGAGGVARVLVVQTAVPAIAIVAAYLLVVLLGVG